MAETAIRRRRFVLLVAPIFAAGLALVVFSEPRSKAETIGAILLLATLVPAAWFFELFAKPKTRFAAAPAFETKQPFVAHIAAELALEPDIDVASPPQGQHQVILAVGKQGFTTRFVVTGGGQLRAGITQRIDIQFLRPEAALAHFPPGGAFTAIERGRPVASGRVLDVNISLPPTVGMKAQ